jgi:hypothetical protein
VTCRRCRRQIGGDDVDVDGDLAQTGVDAAPPGSGSAARGAGLLEQTGKRPDFSVGSTVLIPKGSISPVWLFIAIGAVFLTWFFLHIRSAERKGKDVLLRLRLFRNKTSNLGLGTQTIQWLILQGSFFAVSVYLQEVDHYNAVKTGLMLTPATIGILAASAGADRFARRHPPSGAT